MDKIAYYLNKQKLPSPTDGKFLYCYPAGEKTATFYAGNRGYLTVEVCERDWETLIEMDRSEYNNDRRYRRHTAFLPDVETEDILSLAERERFIDLKADADAMSEDRSGYEYAGRLTEREREIYTLCVIEDRTQRKAAKELHVSKSSVSNVLKKAMEKILRAKLEKASPEEYVCRCWDIFLETGAMPNDSDVELEFILRSLGPDLIVFLRGYYSVGELCRHILKYALFGEDGIAEEIEEYRRTASEKELQRFEAHYGGKPPLLQAVYIRLRAEICRRRRSGLGDSNRVETNICARAEKIAKRLKMTPRDFFARRFCPYFLKSRKKRIARFLRSYPKRKGPERLFPLIVSDPKFFKIYSEQGEECPSGSCGADFFKSFFL